MNKKIIDAVSIVLKYDSEIFPIVRQNFLNSFPGYTAFPGGKVDQQDYELQLEDEQFKNFPNHLINCLVREAKEELGIDIIQLSKLNMIEKIEYIAKAVTPEFNPYRFATYFFLIHLKKKPRIEIDKNEAKEAKWMNPLEIINEYHQGKRLCVPPVKWVIEKIAENHLFEKPLTFEDRFDLENEVPFTESIYKIHQIMPLSDTLPPATRTNAFIIGEILIDPSPKDLKELRKFLNVISQYKLEAIFLTHHHNDHYQNLREIVKELNVPVWLSEDTFQRISKNQGDEFFNDINIKFISDRDVVTTWLGKKVITMAIPGHDEGQLGLYPESKEWFLAGDLFQGIGTVVISPNEGDMIKYFDTLQKVIDLDPKCVIPSHGIALGGTNIIQKTLEHRKMREKQVLEMSLKGYSIEQMLSEIYQDIDPKLWKLAKLNIESHLIKLKKESKLN